MLVVFSLGDCTTAGGFDFSGMVDKTHKWMWKDQQYVVLTLCGTINASCGITGECTSPHCCTFCQLWITDGQEDGACLGKTYTSFTTTSEGIKMKYVGGDPVPQGPQGPAGPREAFIDVICGKVEWDQSGFHEATAIGPDGSYAYNLTVTTSLACGGGGGGGKIGGGGYFLIIILGVVLPVYLLGGVLYNKFQAGKDGIELVPNYDFWVASPGYFVGGCMFTKNKILGLCGRSGYDTVS